MAGKAYLVMVTKHATQIREVLMIRENGFQPSAEDLRRWHGVVNRSMPYESAEFSDLVKRLSASRAAELVLSLRYLHLLNCQRSWSRVRRIEVPIDFSDLYRVWNENYLDGLLSYYRQMIWRVPRERLADPMQLERSIGLRKPNNICIVVRGLYAESLLIVRERRLIINEQQ